MSERIPVIRQVAWISLLPQLTFMALLILLWHQFAVPYPYMWGVLSYILFSFSLRSLLQKEHRAGMMLTRHGNFPEAIHHFENSYGLLVSPCVHRQIRPVHRKNFSNFLKAANLRHIKFKDHESKIGSCMFVAGGAAEQLHR